MPDGVQGFPMPATKLTPSRELVQYIQHHLLRERASCPANRPARRGAPTGISTPASNRSLATPASVPPSPCTGRKQFARRVAGNWPSCPPSRLHPIPHFRLFADGRPGYRVARLRLKTIKRSPARLTTSFPTEEAPTATHNRLGGIAIPGRRTRRTEQRRTIMTHRIACTCFRKW